MCSLPQNVHDHLLLRDCQHALAADGSILLEPVARTDTFASKPLSGPPLRSPLQRASGRMLWEVAGAGGGAAGGGADDDDDADNAAAHADAGADALVGPFFAAGAVLFPPAPPRKGVSQLISP